MGGLIFYKLLPEINLFQQQSGRLIDVGKDSVSFSVKATKFGEHRFF